MNKSDDLLPKKQKEFLEFLEKASEQDLTPKKYEVKDKKADAFHLNSLITKNISLFTKDPNYKLLAWLVVQLVIFSLFILTVTIMKNQLIPYLNSI